MDTFRELAEKRFSLRQFTDEPISDEQLEYILECARLAPSAVNLQPWHFHVVCSPSARKALQACYSREWFTTAPCYVVCTVLHGREWKRKVDGKDHGNIDVAIAAEHFCLAAAEVGLGTCWVCNFDPAVCSEVLQLAPDEEPVVILPIGHADPSVEPAPKNRRSLDELVTRH